MQKYAINTESHHDDICCYPALGRLRQRTAMYSRPAGLNSENLGKATYEDTVFKNKQMSKQ